MQSRLRWNRFLSFSTLFRLIFNWFFILIEVSKNVLLYGGIYSGKILQYNYHLVKEKRSLGLKEILKFRQESLKVEILVIINPLKFNPLSYFLETFYSNSHANCCFIQFDTLTPPPLLRTPT